jgi:hypothetical protein
LPQRLRGEAGEVVVDEGHDGHALRQELDRLGVGPHPLAAVDDDLIQQRRQGIDRLSVTSSRRATARASATA